jgi:hypothetical protein
MSYHVEFPSVTFRCSGASLTPSYSCRTPPEQLLTPSLATITRTPRTAGERHLFPSPFSSSARWSSRPCQAGALKLGEAHSEDLTTVWPTMSCRRPHHVCVTRCCYTLWASPAVASRTACHYGTVP